VKVEQGDEESLDDPVFSGEEGLGLGELFYLRSENA
jgi:hypothetical protein